LFLFLSFVLFSFFLFFSYRLLPELLDILPVRLRLDLVDHVCDHADPFGKASTAAAGAGRADVATLR